MARTRSPNFPYVSLPDAISRIRKVFDNDQRIPSTKEVIAEHIGYAGLSGSALKTISALTKYGLLESVGGGQFKVSDLAMRILFPQDDEDKRAAIAEAAHGPKLFSQLSEQWEGELPSDATFKNYLMRQGFASSAVKKVISSYKETMELVNSGEVAYFEDEDVEPTPRPIKGVAEMQAPKIGIRAEGQVLKGSKPVIRDGAMQEAILKGLSGVGLFPPNHDDVSITIYDDNIMLFGAISTRPKLEKIIAKLEAFKAFLPEKGPQIDEEESYEEVEG